MEEGKEEEQAASPADPLDQVGLELDAEQTRQLLEVLHNPPPANAALRALRKRTPPQGRQTDISEVFGLLEREGQRPISIEEMNDAIASKAAEDQGNLNEQ